MRRAVYLVLACLAGTPVACSPSEPPRGVILILLDAARADRFSSYGYAAPTTPHMDRLAARGLLFPSHYAQGTYTRSSLPTILYSRYYMPPLFPSSDRVPFSAPQDLFRVPDDESISLPKALARAGFRTVMISAHLWLKRETGFAREFDEVYELSSLLEYDRRYRQPRAEHAVDFAIRWLEENGERDYFLYLHLMDTHFPHYFEEDAKRFIDAGAYGNLRLERFRPGGRPDDLGSALTGPERMYLDALYDGSLHYADRHIGRLLDHLGDRIEETLVAITSDHGELLLEHPGRFGHGGRWYEPVARIPLILSYPPRVEPGVWEGLTESIDLMPTLLDLLDVPLPEGKRTDGVSILREGLPPRSHVFMRRAVRGLRFKCLFGEKDPVLLGDPAPDLPGAEGEIYDLEVDPSESANLWTSRQEIASECLSLYRRTMMRPYRRYAEAFANVQPASPFAIGADHFETDRPVARVGSVREGARRLTTEGGWLRIEDSGRVDLVAGRAAGDLRVEFDVPDGRYALSAALRGSATLLAEGGAEVRLAARPLEEIPPLPEVADHVGCGTAEVRDGRIRVAIAPAGDAPFLLRYLGFRPLGPEGETRDADPAAEREMVERLRALGYVD